MSLGTKIYTWFKGNLVGSDELGNKYYCSSKGGFEDSQQTNIKNLLFRMFSGNFLDFSGNGTISWQLSPSRRSESSLNAHRTKLL